MSKILKVGLALTIVIAMLIIGTGTAFAATTASGSEIKGAITAIDKVATPPTVTVTLKEGKTVVLKIDTSTVITKTGLGTITVNDLAVNDKVTATYNKDTNVATQITVVQPLGKRHSFEGTIKSITSTNIVVTTKKGDETFKVGSETVYKVPGVKDATLAKFKVGDKVSVSTADVTTGGTTVQMAQRMSLIPAKPVKVTRTGTVTAYTANSSITILDKKGNSSTFFINADTKINFKKGATTVKIGDRVTISASRPPADSQYLAKSIRDFGTKETNHNRHNSNQTGQGTNNEHSKNNNK